MDKASSCSSNDSVEEYLKFAKLIKEKRLDFDRLKSFFENSNDEDVTSVIEPEKTPVLTTQHSTIETENDDILPKPLTNVPSVAGPSTKTENEEDSDKSKRKKKEKKSRRISLENKNRKSIDSNDDERGPKIQTLDRMNPKVVCELLVNTESITTTHSKTEKEHSAPDGDKVDSVLSEGEEDRDLTVLQKSRKRKRLTIDSDENNSDVDVPSQAKTDFSEPEKKLSPKKRTCERDESVSDTKGHESDAEIGESAGKETTEKKKSPKKRTKKRRSTCERDESVSDAKGHESDAEIGESAGKETTEKKKSPKKRTEKRRSTCERDESVFDTKSHESAAEVGESAGKETTSESSTVPHEKKEKRRKKKKKEKRQVENEEQETNDDVDSYEATDTDASLFHEQEDRKEKKKRKKERRRKSEESILESKGNGSDMVSLPITEEKTVNDLSLHQQVDKIHKEKDKEKGNSQKKETRKTEETEVVILQDEVDTKNNFDNIMPDKLSKKKSQKKSKRFLNKDDDEAAAQTFYKISDKYMRVQLERLSKKIIDEWTGWKKKSTNPESDEVDNKRTVGTSCKSKLNEKLNESHSGKSKRLNEEKSGKSGSHKERSDKANLHKVKSGKVSKEYVRQKTEPAKNFKSPEKAKDPKALPSVCAPLALNSDSKSKFKIPKISKSKSTEPPPSSTADIFKMPDCPVKRIQTSSKKKSNVQAPKQEVQSNKSDYLENRVSTTEVRVEKPEQEERSGLSKESSTLPLSLYNDSILRDISMNKTLPSFDDLDYEPDDDCISIAATDLQMEDEDEEDMRQYLTSKQGFTFVSNVVKMEVSKNSSSNEALHNSSSDDSDPNYKKVENSNSSESENDLQVSTVYRSRSSSFSASSRLEMNLDYPPPLEDRDDRLEAQNSSEKGLDQPLNGCKNMEVPSSEPTVASDNIADKTADEVRGNEANRSLSPGTPSLVESVGFPVESYSSKPEVHSSENLNEDVPLCNNLCNTSEMNGNIQATESADTQERLSLLLDSQSPNVEESHALGVVVNLNISDVQREGSLGTTSPASSAHVSRGSRATPELERQLNSEVEKSPKLQNVSKIAPYNVVSPRNFNNKCVKRSRSSERMVKDIEQSFCSDFLENGVCKLDCSCLGEKFVFSDLDTNCVPGLMRWKFEHRHFFDEYLPEALRFFINDQDKILSLSEELWKRDCDLKQFKLLDNSKSFWIELVDSLVRLGLANGEAMERLLERLITRVKINNEILDHVVNSLSDKCLPYPQRPWPAIKQLTKVQDYEVPPHLTKILLKHCIKTKESDTCKEVEKCLIPHVVCHDGELRNLVDKFKRVVRKLEEEEEKREATGCNASPNANVKSNANGPLLSPYDRIKSLSIPSPRSYALGNDRGRLQEFWGEPRKNYERYHHQTTPEAGYLPNLMSVNVPVPRNNNISPSQMIVSKQDESRTMEDLICDSSGRRNINLGSDNEKIIKRSLLKTPVTGQTQAPQIRTSPQARTLKTPEVSSTVADNIPSFPPLEDKMTSSRVKKTLPVKNGPNTKKKHISDLIKSEHLGILAAKMKNWNLDHVERGSEQLFNAYMEHHRNDLANKFIKLLKFMPWDRNFVIYEAFASVGFTIILELFGAHNFEDAYAVLKVLIDLDIDPTLGQIVNNGDRISASGKVLTMVDIFKRTDHLRCAARMLLEKNMVSCGREEWPLASEARDVELRDRICEELFSLSKRSSDTLDDAVKLYQAMLLGKSSYTNLNVTGMLELLLRALVRHRRFEDASNLLEFVDEHYGIRIANEVTIRMLLSVCFKHFTKTHRRKPTRILSETDVYRTFETKFLGPETKVSLLVAKSCWFNHEIHVAVRKLCLHPPIVDGLLIKKADPPTSTASDEDYPEGLEDIDSSLEAMFERVQSECKNLHPKLIKNYFLEDEQIIVLFNPDAKRSYGREEKKREEKEMNASVRSQANCPPNALPPANNNVEQALHFQNSSNSYPQNQLSLGNIIAQPLVPGPSSDNLEKTLQRQNSTSNSLSSANCNNVSNSANNHNFASRMPHSMNFPMANQNTVVPIQNSSFGMPNQNSLNPSYIQGPYIHPEELQRAASIPLSDADMSVLKRRALKLDSESGSSSSPFDTTTTALAPCAPMDERHGIVPSLQNHRTAYEYLGAPEGGRQNIVPPLMEDRFTGASASPGAPGGGRQDSIPSLPNRAFSTRTSEYDRRAPGGGRQNIVSPPQVHRFTGETASPAASGGGRQESVPALHQHGFPMVTSGAPGGARQDSIPPLPNHAFSTRTSDYDRRAHGGGRQDSVPPLPEHRITRGSAALGAPGGGRQDNVPALPEHRITRGSAALGAPGGGRQDNVPALHNHLFPMVTSGSPGGARQDSIHPLPNHAFSTRTSDYDRRAPGGGRQNIVPPPQEHRITRGSAALGGPVGGLSSRQSHPSTLNENEEDSRLHNPFFQHDPSPMFPIPNTGLRHSQERNSNQGFNLNNYDHLNQHFERHDEAQQQNRNHSPIWPPDFREPPRNQYGQQQQRSRRAGRFNRGRGGKQHHRNNWN